MALAIYLLCALTSAACAWLLFRGFAQTRARMLFWSALCFSVLTVSNAILVLDRFVFTEVDLFALRLATALAAMLLMVVGLIWERE